MQRRCRRNPQGVFANRVLQQMAPSGGAHKRFAGDAGWPEIDARVVAMQEVVKGVAETEIGSGGGGGEDHRGGEHAMDNIWHVGTDLHRGRDIVGVVARIQQGISHINGTTGQAWRCWWRIVLGCDRVGGRGYNRDIVRGCRGRGQLGLRGRWRISN